MRAALFLGKRLYFISKNSKFIFVTFLARKGGVGGGIYRLWYCGFLSKGECVNVLSSAKCVTYET